MPQMFAPFVTERMLEFEDARKVERGAEPRPVPWQSVLFETTIPEVSPIEAAEARRRRLRRDELAASAQQRYEGYEPVEVEQALLAHPNNHCFRDRHKDLEHSGEWFSPRTSGVVHLPTYRY